MSEVTEKAIDAWNRGTRPVVSICIPVYYSGPDVPRVLNELLTSIEAQDYPQIRKIVSLQACDKEDMNKLRAVVANRNILTYYPLATSVNGPAQNTNVAMNFVGQDGYIKIMNQDDFLDSPTTISEMVEMVEQSNARWLVNACIHTDKDGQVRERPHRPFWPGEKGMVEGVNRFGCPSVVMFDAKLSMGCDPALEYAMDCDMWIQLYKAAGAPIIRNVPDVVIRMWDTQLSNQLDIGPALERDKAYMRDKYGYE